MVPEDSGTPATRGRLNTALWLLLVTALGLPVIAPLLRLTAVACTHDGHLHYHRIAAMRHAWENGVYLTRWLPDLAYGYGYPFFVYREAGPLYAVFLPHLAGLPLPAASNLFYALSILAAGWFMFLWVRDIFGPRPGVVAAVAYMAAPYVLVDALVRGNSPESMAVPLFPLLLWLGRRWVLGGSMWTFLGGVLALALLSLSHNISTLIFAPTLLVYLLAVVWVNGRAPSTRLINNGYARLALLLVLGLGLAFFYTGGALLEMDQVTLEMSTTTRNNDWRLNFTSLGEVLAPVAAEDPNLVNPPLLFRLGWAPLGLALLGVTGLFWIKGGDRAAREQRVHIWLMALAAAAFLLMTLPLARPLWDALPLIDFVQFPWRFVGRAALPVAFLAGVGLANPWLAPGGRRTWLPAVATTAAVALLLLETLPNLYPRYCVEEPFPSIQTVHTYEHVTGLVGVDPEGSYFPRTVEERPAGSPLETDYQSGRPPERFDTTVLPPGAAVSDVVYTPRGVSLVVDSPEPFTARYLSFAFPGWTATIDGERVPIAAESPSGLITFTVPGGQHAVEVGWEATPLRRALVGLSLLAAAAALAVVVVGRRTTVTVVIPPTPAPDRWDWLALLAVAALALALYWLAPWSPTAAPPVDTPQTLQGGALRLDGYSLSRAETAAGQTFDIDMAWTAVAPPAADYQTNVWLVDEDGRVWSDKGTERPRIYEDAPPSRLWVTGEWGWDSREVAVLPGTPPRTYDIILTLFDRATLQPVTLVDTVTGAVIGPEAVIGQMAVTNPAEPPAFAPQFPLDVAVPGSALRLLGYNQDRDAAAPGEAVLLTLFWQCADPAQCDEITVDLLDDAGKVVEQWRVPAIREDFQPGDWPSHGRLRGQYSLRLPADLGSGTYDFTLNGAVPLGALAIEAPERVYERPPLALDVDAPFATVDGETIITLAGVAEADGSCLAPDAGSTSCTLPLVWRVEAETPVSYHVFVHVVDEAGTIQAQSDSQPANWTRPTTGWLPGEYVPDARTLSLPAGLSESLALRIGLYDPATGERLQTDEGEFEELPVSVTD